MAKRALLFEMPQVQYIRQTLGAAFSYLHAQDMADGQRHMRLDPDGNVIESALTREVKDCLALIEDEMRQALLDDFDGKPEPTEEDTIGPDEPDDDDEEGDYLDDPDEIDLTGDEDDDDEEDDD